MSNSMLLSDAIRIGCAFNKQGFHALKLEDGSTCALGAALEGLGINLGRKRVSIDYTITGELIPLSTALPSYVNDFTKVLECPHCVKPNKMYSVRNTVMHLNDTHGVSREDIADFVEQWEIANGHKAAAAKPEVTEVAQEAELVAVN